MKSKTLHLFLLTATFMSSLSFGQNVSLFKQLNGQFNFVFIGNTMNPEENTYQTTPSIFTTSSSNLDLNPNDVIEKAYLYWAGSGTGDFDVKLNNQNITPDRTFSFKSQTLAFFSAFKEVTNQIKETGNGNYTLSELDISPFIGQHHNNRTNFAGWCLVIVYQNSALPLNQLNIYDGLQVVPSELKIVLEDLNVIDTKEAKIGFVAWEGDDGLSENEKLTLNGISINNPPLNPNENVFNGTNSFTNSATLYNMDLDVYSIENAIAVGDTSAEIKLTSSRDVVLINAIVTQLNSQLPDATIALQNPETSCDSRTISVEYTISNSNSTEVLPKNTPISIYCNTEYLTTIFTRNILPIDAIENGKMSLTIPNNIPDIFNLKFVVDQTENGNGIVPEINENNNDFQIEIVLKKTPLLNAIPNIETCNQGFNQATTKLSEYGELIKQNSNDVISFFETPENAQENSFPIFNTTSYQTTVSPKTIYTRVENEFCYTTSSIVIKTKNCLPKVYNYVSVNNDGKNETFHVDGLKNIFFNHETFIYNRWGTLVWKGNHSTNEWDGFANKGLKIDQNSIPSGTYFYVIDLNDPDYPESLRGYLFLSR